MNRLLTISITLLLLCSNLQAQNWGSKLKDKMLHKMENKADQKIDNAADRVLKETVDDSEQALKDGVKKDNKEKETNSQAQQPPSTGEVDYEQLNQLMEQYSGSGSPGGTQVSFEEADLSNVQPSDVIGKFTMIMESYAANGKKKEKESGQITYHIDTYKIAMIPENFDSKQKGTATMIIDRKMGTITTLMDEDGKKQGFKMKMPKIVVEDDDADVALMGEFNITNETKIIDGKKCVKITAEDENSKSVSWATKDLNISMAEMLNYFQVSSKKENSSWDNLKDLEDYMIVEAETIDKKSGDKMIMKTKDVVTGKVDKSVFSEDGYNVMDMSGGIQDLMKQFGGQ